jgi:hypothetical protein
VRSIYLSDQAKASGETLEDNHKDIQDVNQIEKVQKRAALQAQT